MKLRRFNTISTIPGAMSIGEIELSDCEPVGEYCVDDSRFVPRSEVLGAFRSQGDMPSSQMYDFPDGKDNGLSIPSNRLHSYTGDIAEASVALRSAQATAKENLDRSKIDYINEQAKESAQAASQSPANE